MYVGSLGPVLALQRLHSVLANSEQERREFEELASEYEFGDLLDKKTL